MKLSHIVVSGAIALCLSLSAKAGTYTFAANLTGGAESPPVVTPASGWTSVIYDDVMHTLTVHIAFSGLLGPTTAAHIHAAAVLMSGNAGVAVTPSTLPGFPAGVTSYDYHQVVDLTLMGSYTAAFRTANGGTVASAEAALFEYMKTDRAYVNVHTTSFPGGEIRGYLVQVPDTATTAYLFTLALGVMGLIARRSRVTT